MGKRRRRVAYYDAFSHVYNGFVELHSGDQGGGLRDELAAAVGLQMGDKALDLCTGTGAMLPALLRQVGSGGRVVGVDFSPGMLHQAKKRVAGRSYVQLVEADVTRLPFPDNHFDGAVCSHAFYELKDEAPLQFLHEVHRVLKPGKSFLMMEHDVPENPLVRFLFYLRILSMGSRKTLEILRREQEFFAAVFPQVEKRQSTTGNSKIYRCTKAA